MSDTSNGILIAEIEVPKFIMEEEACARDARNLPRIFLGSGTICLTMGVAFDLMMTGVIYLPEAAFLVAMILGALSALVAIFSLSALTSVGLPWRILSDPRRPFVETSASEFERFNADAQLINQLHQARQLGGTWTSQDNQFVEQCREQRARLERVVEISAILAQSGPLGSVAASSVASRSLLTETFDADALHEHGTRLHDVAIRRNTEREVEKF